MDENFIKTSVKQLNSGKYDLPTAFDKQAAGQSPHYT